MHQSIIYVLTYLQQRHEGTGGARGEGATHFKEQLLRTHAAAKRTITESMMRCVGSLSSGSAKRIITESMRRCVGSLSSGSAKRIISR